MTSTISSKGQITVPKGLRDRLGLRAGSTVEFQLTEDGVLLRKGHLGKRPVDRVRGIVERHRRTDDVMDDLRGPVAAMPRARK